MSDKKLQAKHLFFQTELNKTQIAELLNISRRTLHYWIKEGNWERLKRSADHMPSIIAENCYHLLDKLTRSYLSERRLSSPATPREIDALHKLTLTINKLKGRAVLNENVEMFAYFLDKLKAKAPEVAETIAPFVDEYLSERANMYTTDPDILPPGFTETGYIPMTSETEVEKQERLKDGKDIIDWDYESYWQQQLTNLDQPEPDVETPELVDTPMNSPYTHSHTEAEPVAQPTTITPPHPLSSVPPLPLSHPLSSVPPLPLSSVPPLPLSHPLAPSPGVVDSRIDTNIEVCHSELVEEPRFRTNYDFRRPFDHCETEEDYMQYSEEELRDYITEYISKKEKLTGVPIPGLPDILGLPKDTPKLTSKELAKLKNENLVSRLAETGRRGGSSAPWADIEQYLSNRKSGKLAQPLENQKRPPMTNPKNFFPIKVSSIRFSTPPMAPIFYINKTLPQSRKYLFQ